MGDDKPVRLIKWQKVGLENLLISPCLKRRIRRRAVGDYRIGEHQIPHCPFNVAPAKVQFL
jgi:hypothetical protein